MFVFTDVVTKEKNLILFNVTYRDSLKLNYFQVEFTHSGQTVRFKKIVLFSLQNTLF